MALGDGNVLILEFPEYAYRGQQRHPVVVAEFQRLITARVFFEIPVDATDVATIEQVLNFYKRQQRTAANIKLATQTNVHA